MHMIPVYIGCRTYAYKPVQCVNRECRVWYRIASSYRSFALGLALNRVSAKPLAARTFLAEFLLLSDDYEM
jgi:hypothetical protein